jgi:tRNA (adenine22-N1)-methyltransferase
MLKLSKRMHAVAAMVTPGGVLADVGTDHGYVPIALLQRQKIRGAIAMDINEGPLARARENIAAAHLEDYIETRLSDGVQAMRPGEADSILIAGMGGELILHILAEGAKICETAGELILQPQSDIRKVREYLREHNYRIIDEDMVCEDGKYYPMMRAIRVEKDEAWERMNEQTRATCDLYGPLLLRNGNPVLRRFLVREHGQLTQLLQKLAAQQESDTIRKRMSEVQKELQFNESAYTILGAIKDAGI